MLFQHGAGAVLGVGDLPEAQRGNVFFVALFSKFYGAGGAADEHGQHACGHGIQRPAVADAFFVEDSPEFGAYVHGSPIGRLVNNQDAVWHSITSCVL